MGRCPVALRVTDRPPSPAGAFGEECIFAHCVVSVKRGCSKLRVSGRQIPVGDAR